MEPVVTSSATPDAASGSSVSPGVVGGSSLALDSVGGITGSSDKTPDVVALVLISFLVFIII